MKSLSTRLAILTTCLAWAFSAPALFADPVSYTIDRAHSSVGFSVRHFFNEVPGRFTDFDGTLVYDAAKPEASTIELTVQAASINTDLERRDDHLRSGDFFDAEKHPAVTFKSVSVQAKDATTLAVNGDFTLRGVTQRMTVPVEILGVMELGGGAAKAAFRAELTIDRQDFGVRWNQKLDNGGTILGDDVKITIVLQADRVVP